MRAADRTPARRPEGGGRATCNITSEAVDLGGIKGAQRSMTRAIHHPDAPVSRRGGWALP